MSVITRIDARSQKNNSLQVQDAAGNILATIEVVGNHDKDVGKNKLRNEAYLRLQTADGVRIVKSTGVVLRKK